MAVVAVLVVGAVGVLGSAPAGAGGGCHSGATQGRDTTVKLEGMCFLPTVQRVADGATVTFINGDSFMHVVSGVGMDYTELAPGASFTQTFRGTGVYPYMCHLHPGMTGAVMVGDGLGAAQLVDVQPARTLADAPLTAQPTALRTNSDKTSPLVFVVIALLAAAAGLAGGVVLGRTRRRNA